MTQTGGGGARSPSGHAGDIALFGGPPTLDRDAQVKWPDVTDAERAAVARVLDRGVLSGSNAPEAVALEREFARFVGARHAILTHCGTSALHLALAAAGVRAGDHVVMPAYSFVATPLAALHCGAIPVFVDVDPATGLMDAKAAAAAVGPRTRAIMPVHVHGCAADLRPLLDLAKSRGVALVEDAAQAHGATWSGKPVGAIGRTGGFSLQSSKNLTGGEGGIFVTNDDALADEANRLRNFGQDLASIASGERGFDMDRPLDATRAVESHRIGWMYRGNEMMAAFVRARLARLPEQTAAAQKNAERLSRALAELPGVLPPAAPPGCTSVHHKYRVRLDPAAAGLDLAPRVLRDAMMRALQAEGLDVVLWQTDALPAQPVFQSREGFGAGWPWSLDRETDFARLYEPARFPATRALLDGSLVLFSQSCPLIAQTATTVDRYAEGFARVWSRREELAAWAKRERLSSAAAE
jgi:perosamine synthetase